MNYLTLEGLKDVFKRNKVELSDEQTNSVFIALCNEGIIQNQAQLDDKTLGEALYHTGYTVTNANIAKLRKKLANGTAYLDEEVDVEYYKKMLVEQHKETTSKNLNILIEGIENGTYDFDGTHQIKKCLVIVQ